MWLWIQYNSIQYTTIQWVFLERHDVYAGWVQRRLGRLRYVLRVKGGCEQCGFQSWFEDGQAVSLDEAVWSMTNSWGAKKWRGREGQRAPYPMFVPGARHPCYATGAVSKQNAWKCSENKTKHAINTCNATLWESLAQRKKKPPSADLNASTLTSSLKYGLELSVSTP